MLPPIRIVNASIGLEIKFHRRKPTCARKVGQVIGFLKTKWGDADDAKPEINLNLELDGKPDNFSKIDAKVSPAVQTRF
ncbi:MAG: hypothetical protein AB8G99_09130 [Planctomycetaceae bacterium]